MLVKPSIRKERRRSPDPCHPFNYKAHNGFLRPTDNPMRTLDVPDQLLRHYLPARPFGPDHFARLVTLVWRRLQRTRSYRLQRIGNSSPLHSMLRGEVMSQWSSPCLGRFAVIRISVFGPKRRNCQSCQLISVWKCFQQNLNH